MGDQVKWKGVRKEDRAILKAAATGKYRTDVPRYRSALNVPSVQATYWGCRRPWTTQIQRAAFTALTICGSVDSTTIVFARIIMNQIGPASQLGVVCLVYFYFIFAPGVN